MWTATTTGHAVIVRARRDGERDQPSISRFAMDSVGRCELTTGVDSIGLTVGMTAGDRWGESSSGLSESVTATERLW
jgi:hypothetical protein